MNVLVINAGSSSLKYQLLNPTTGELLAKGLCERIGIDGLFTYKPQLPGKEAIKAASVSMPTHSEAIQAVLNALVDEKNGVIGSMKEIDAVGHRVVHGGEKFAKSVVITDEVMQAIEECTPLAPLHNPANIIGINLVGTIVVMVIVVQPSPPSPSPAMHGPFLTKMLVSMAFAIWFMFSMLRECIAAVWWQPPSSFTASAMASATLATRTTGSTGIISSVTANGCSAVVSTNSSRVCSGTLRPIAAAIFAASRPNFNLPAFNIVEYVP